MKRLELRWERRSYDAVDVRNGHAHDLHRAQLPQHRRGRRLRALGWSMRRSVAHVVDSGTFWVGRWCLSRRLASLQHVRRTVTCELGWQELGELACDGLWVLLMLARWRDDGSGCCGGCICERTGRSD